MNQIKASISSGYRWRLVLITIVMLGFGAYCVYDWQIGYPKKVEMYETYKQIEADHPTDYPQRWSEYAAQKGWDTRTPKRKTDRDVFTQLLMAIIVIPIGLFFAFKLVRESGRWVAMDEHGLTARGGVEASWDQVTGLDESRWKTKGIAYAQYNDGQGNTKKLLLDDFKMEREPTKAIVDRVREQVDPEAAAALAEARAQAEAEAAARAAAEETQDPPSEHGR
jgi:hypothetical protein